MTCLGIEIVFEILILRPLQVYYKYICLYTNFKALNPKLRALLKDLNGGNLIVIGFELATF